MPDSAKPTGVTVLSYNVGFGDCFLLLFKYANGTKSVWIDFGSRKKPAGGSDALEKAVADIKSRCRKDNRCWVDAVVITHGHSDHVSGFRKALCSDIGVGLLVKPWTSDPSASAPVHTLLDRSGAGLAPRNRRALKIQELKDIRSFAGTVLAEAARKDLFSSADQNLLKGMAEMALSAEVKDGVFREVKDREYLNCGDPSKIGKILPGVKVHVLGPPDVTQAADILKKVAGESDEYWLRAAFWRLQAAGRRAPGGAPQPLFAKKFLAARQSPPWARWLIRKLKKSYVADRAALLEIANAAENNTSVILVFEVKGRFLVFPGDAQLEDWSYALSQPEYRKLLKKTAFYKVGHHGSRNATPKSLWELFEKKGAGKTLVTALSTLSGTFDKSEEGKIPKETLLTALKDKSTLKNTEGRPVGVGEEVYSIP